MNRKPKILLLDIETSSMKGDAWRRYDTTLHHIREYTQLLSFAYKWLGDRKIVCETRQHQSEKILSRKLLRLINKADIVIAHNGDRFDFIKAHARFAINDLGVPRPYSTIDTRKVARKYFGFDSNSLDDLAKMFGLGRKLPHIGYDMWLGCEEGDPKCWRLMERYNKHDVYLLEGVYKKLRPWINNHPNVSQFMNRSDGCPKCGGTEFTSVGIRYALRTAYRRLQCLSCGGWSREAVAMDSLPKPKVVNS